MGSPERPETIVIPVSTLGGVYPKIIIYFSFNNVPFSHTQKKIMKLIDDFKKHNYFYNKILIDVILFFIPFLGIYLFIYSFLNYFSILNIYTYEDFMFFYEETSFEGFLDVDYWWFFYIFSTFILSILSIVFFIKRYKIRNIERPKYLFQLIYTPI